MKEQLDVLKILGERDADQLDVSKILGEKNNDQLDVSKILQGNKKQNQEQQLAPDFDLFNAIRQGGNPEPPAPAEIPAPCAETAPEQPASVTNQEKTEPIVTQKPQESTICTREACPDAKNRSHRLLYLVIKLAAAVVALMLITAFVVSGFIITSDTMAPTIGKGDSVIVNKMTKSYRAGDIVMFRDFNDQKQFMRIVATDGDMVDIRKDGNLYINGEVETQEYVMGETLITDANVYYPLLVSENEFFVMGDNRENSTDSRNYDFGTIHEDQIVGKVIYCINKFK